MLSNLLKYRRLVLLEAQSSLAYRFSVFCSIAVYVFPVIARIIFWKAVYGAADGNIAGFDRVDMIMYLLVYSFVFEMTWINRGGVRQNILHGALTSHLLKPSATSSLSFLRL